MKSGNDSGLGGGADGYDDNLDSSLQMNQQQQQQQQNRRKQQQQRTTSLSTPFDIGSQSDSGLPDDQPIENELLPNESTSLADKNTTKGGGNKRQPIAGHPAKPHPSIGRKMAALVGLSKRKSQSTSQIGDIGKRGKASFQRSEEVGAAVDMKMKRQTSRDSTDSGANNYGVSTASHGGSSNSFGGAVGGPSSSAGNSSDSVAMWQSSGGSAMISSSDSSQQQQQLSSFIDGLGPGQLVGRQVLGTACLGQIQLGLTARKGCLEVEVIRARGLVPKSGTRILPAPYIKVYLMDGKRRVEKQKTSIARRTLDPLYQQVLIFAEPFCGKTLQVTIWGDYGRLDRKIFMGVVQINLDELNLTSLVIGWYKLFTHSSLVVGSGVGGTGVSGSLSGVGGGGGGGSSSGLRQQTSVSSQESSYHVSSTAGNRS
ncbi:hypothetical protein HELRODRAFT_115969 [Helobdella robusta]|uniref:C2 domain-containing protein n=1 Tax=Helobdella robusta TaxID=6412 RepID=T1EGC2_HELRO|nr:hypothetical protein HELRODRAFT_115969 [Helobdella robusta]ESN92342.1 hypothetical protein HELRODRAFT_115969 [Helobdella robusta]